MRKTISIAQSALGLSFYVLGLMLETLGSPLTIILYITASAFLSFKALLFLNALTNYMLFFVNPIAYLLFRFDLFNNFVGVW